MRCGPVNQISIGRRGPSRTSCPPEHVPDHCYQYVYPRIGLGHFCLALQLSHRCSPDYIFGSSHAQLYRHHMSIRVATRRVSTEPPVRVPSVFPN